MIPDIKAEVIFLEEKQKTKQNYPAPPISNLPFGNIFYNLKHTNPSE
jgi:hypothetical protein